MKSNGVNARPARPCWWAAIVLVTCLVSAVPAAAQDAERERERERHVAHLHDILEGLERGMVALEKLERREAWEMLERIADEVRREIGEARPPERDRVRRRGGEREIIHDQIEVLRLAMRALLEAERQDAAELVEHAIHARELLLEGRRDREAREIRERAPGRGQVVELLALAEELYREFDLEEMADRISALTEELWDEQTGRRSERVRERERVRRREAGQEDRDRERARAERNERRRVERERRGERSRERGRDRIEQLQERLEDLQRELEAIRRELHERG